ncbi:axoneme-associated protein mst101(2)-like [Olea europaea var. sylvestris]|uniref:axoneme-associated protein mst101(2)-like n=1 Tax=Olea europaea var. sylvestris TaxID=158386 RepID=UPI000C1D7ED6|nr:axoneme-associated protein mst101(2)-like [Olea europaea var. sylvestris]
MESTSGRELVTVASLDYGVSHRGDSEVDRYAMTEEPVDHTEEWRASRVPSSMTWKRLGEIRERYSAPHTIEILVPEPNERACYPRPSCVAVSEYLFKAEEGIPAPDMASILKATSTVKARPLKSGSSGAKEVRGRVEHLSKDSTSRASEEGTQRQEKPKEPRGKEKVPEEAKRRKLVHVTSSEAEAEAEEAREEAARRAAEAAEEEATKQKPLREKDKSPSFLASREETLASALVEDLPQEIRSSEEKRASLAEELKAAKAEAEEGRAQKVEELAKLESALTQIEALKKEVYESQCEVASLTNKVEVSNEHQKVTAEALEKANAHLASSQEAYQFLEGQVKWYVDDASHAREEAQ